VKNVAIWLGEVFGGPPRYSEEHSGHRTVLERHLNLGLPPDQIGIAIGLPLAVATKQLAASLLFGLSPLDPGAMIGSTLLLAALAMLVGYLPARRAATMDPVLALRHE